MEALIVSKTQMNNQMCVGAILQNGRGIRLLDASGHNQPENTPLKVGQIWNLDFKNKPDTVNPHTEDVLVTSAKLLSNGIPDLRSHLTEKIGIRVWEDSNEIFEGKVGWTNNGSGYVCERLGVPEYSVGFFTCENDLKFDDDKHYIINSPSLYSFMPVRRFAYVGTEDPIPIIPAGTLVRISLARWWKPKDVDMEERCYVQVSGWY